MRGLKKWPSTDALEQAYLRLQSAEPVSAEDLVLFSQWCRVDARLAEIWIQRYTNDWSKYSPIELRAELSRQPWPLAFGVLSDQAARYGGMKRAEKKILRTLTRAVLHGFEHASGENFFILHAPLGSKSLEKDAAQSDPTYRRWGYFGRDVLPRAAAKAKFGTQTRIRRSDRLRFLDQWLKCRKRFRIDEYRDALERRVSMRVAQQDLAGSKRVKRVGNTKARYYVVLGV